MFEVLDPEQHSQFSDQFIEETYDQSNVIFIATANYVNNIPRPLLDRMELITILGYTEVEKAQIAKRHLIRKQIKENDLTSGQLQIRELSILKLIRTYKRKSEVRE